MRSQPPARIIAKVITRLLAALLIGVVGWSVVTVVRTIWGHESAGAQQQPDDGLRRSGTASSGEFRTASLHIPPTHQRARVNRYQVRVETTLEIDANQAARQIQSVLDDDRGWVSTRTKPSTGNSFELVSDPAHAQFTITIATPGTVDAQCPLDTQGIWSCDDGHHILLNSDRWLYRTPIYADTDLYRAFMINHEVGHYLGLKHSTCAGPGHIAPVMMQQSKGLQGCRANAWPTMSG